MSDLRIARARRAPDERLRDRYSADDIANELVPRRDHLVDQVPRELAAARGLSRDQWEIAVDEAIDYLVTEFAKPLNSPDDLDRVFWKAVSLRIKRVHEGRGATIRAGWQWVDLNVTDLPTVDTDPERVAIEHDERATLLEFSATLTDRERQVLACQYAGRERKQGRVVIARQLDMRIGEVRKHERNITRKLERFAAILAAGSLCTHREPQLAALTSGALTPETERIALLHLAHCPACRVEHVARLRSIRSGELPREIANVLPAPIIIERSNQRGMLEFPRFRGHLIAGLSGLAARISVHACAVFIGVPPRGGQLAQTQRQVGAGVGRRAGCLAAVAAELGASA